MQSPQRSKSFKALSMAQPIKKDIEQTLNQLQQQKRKYLANERQQALLKQQLDRKRKQLNQIKDQVPVTQIDQKRTTQTNLKFRNTDRTYQVVLGSIQKTKDQIDMGRKRVRKFKQYNQKLSQDQQELIKQIDKLVDNIVQKQSQNDNLKKEIINYRDLNMKNLNQFRKSHKTLAKSNFKDQNQRRKFAVSTKTFLGEEHKLSRVVHYDKISDTLRSSGIMTNEGKADILADSIPIAKERVNVIIHKNKQKIKIAQNYMKFGEGLQNLFKIIKQYKGRDDVDYLAEQFVKKQKQIQKLGQYIGKLQYQIVSSRRQVYKKQKIQNQLQKQLTAQTHNQSEKRYKQMTKIVKEQVQQLKKQSLKMNQWMKKIAENLCPLAGDQDFSRGNAVNVIGKIQQKLNINKSLINQRKQPTQNKAHPTAPLVQPEDHHQKYAELLSYQKMKQYADEFIKSKKP